MITKYVPVWFRVTFPIAASLALFLFMIFGVYTPQVKQRLIEQKKIQIQDIVESAAGVLTYNYSQYSVGKMTEEQAKKNAIETITEMKFGPDFKDYFWITDYCPRMVMHPYRSDLNGKDLKNFTDPTGKHLFVDMVKATAKDGQGFVNYQWQWKDDSSVIVPKISFVKRFEPWHWIIGTGVYMNDIDNEVKAQTHKIFIYTFSIFLFVIMFSVISIFSGLRTNKKLHKREIELSLLNEGLENRVKQRTSELQDSIDNLRKTQNQLIESEKMASLGNLVAGVAHEINTPIGIGVTTASHLEEKLEEIKTQFNSGQMKKSDLDKYIEHTGESLGIITTNLNRAANLVKSFKQVAVDQTSEMPREFNIKHYLGDILMSLKPKLKQTKHEVIITAPDDLVITSYPGAFMQIFSNLIVNSLLHGFEGIEQGQIKIEVKEDNGNITLLYSDNGQGMTQEQLTRLYEPFYTTKRNNGGSGLGMNIVYNLITRLLRGTIFVSSEKGKGTLFIISLPMEKK